MLYLHILPLNNFNRFEKEALLSIHVWSFYFTNKVVHDSHNAVYIFHVCILFILDLSYLVFNRNVSVAHCFQCLCRSNLLNVNYTAYISFFTLDERPLQDTLFAGKSNRKFDVNINKSLVRFHSLPLLFVVAEQQNVFIETTLLEISSFCRDVTEPEFDVSTDFFRIFNCYLYSASGFVNAPDDPLCVFPAKFVKTRPVPGISTHTAFPTIGNPLSLRWQNNTIRHCGIYMYLLLPYLTI